MCTLRRTTILALAPLLVACSEPAATPLDIETSGEIPVVFNAWHGGESHNFGSPLSGAEEEPPVDTRARGNAIFKLAKDGTELHFRLIVANIQDVTQAHIHCGARGVNGPVVLWLYPSGPSPQLIEGRSSGVLRTATVTTEDIVARPDSEACPGGVADLDDLVAKMRAGGAYTNVHTSENPPGEVRGQIRARGPGM